MNKKLVTEYVIGPFNQVLTMENLPLGGAIKDHELTVHPNAAIYIKNGFIETILPCNECRKLSPNFIEIDTPAVALPGLIDAHTHLCFAGSRAHDYALRLQGLSYQQIAAQGGGILSTVAHTRAASSNELATALKERLNTAQSHGVTTCEIKSGYGLSVEEEIKLLETIKQVGEEHPISLIPTCLAAHTIPSEYHSGKSYLEMLQKELFPLLIQKKLTRRIDIFIDQSAFSVEEARIYLESAKQLNFSLIIHADQFTRGGAQLAAEIGALSADHLEVSNIQDALALKAAGVIPIVLPGATLGLGMPFPPARMLLDQGLPLVIASDWNPGSAPMGNLLTEAALLGAAQRLTMAETLAALTQRAARALELTDRGMLLQGMRADIAVFPCKDYREILYHQGTLNPSMTIIKGKL